MTVLMASPLFALFTNNGLWYMFMQDMNGADFASALRGSTSKRLLVLAKQLASSDVPVLIGGESGVGKAVVARYIHDSSARKDQPFITVYCATMPENMLETTLLGYEKNTYDGAIKNHRGKLGQAQRGTLLLDDISQLPFALQDKLLHVLQKSNMEWLNVRIIATTSQNLLPEMADQLKFSLIHWVPLRERALDIIPFANYLLAHHAALMNRSIPIFSTQAEQSLLAYSWPGNECEMNNVMQRALILATDGVLKAEYFQLNVALVDESLHTTNNKYARSLDEQEYELILKILNEAHGNRSLAAKMLNISPRTLRYKLAKMREKGFSVPRRGRGKKAEKIKQEA